MSIAVVEPDGRVREDVELRFTKGGAELSVGDEKLFVDADLFADGRSDGHATLQKLGARLASSGRRLVGCGSCGRFQFSGMSRDMSGGSVGYCLRVGHRNRRGTVEIQHRCGEHVYLDGWEGQGAWQLEAIRERRKRAHQERRIGSFEGAIVGLAVGDALGFPCEFRSLAQILSSFPPAGIDDFVALHDPRWQGGVFIAGRERPAGTFSDDTQMSIAVAEALLDSPEGDVDDVMQAMARRFVEWSRADDNDRAPGNTCMTGCQNLAAGVSWRDAGVAESKGAGAPMRVVPIGLRYFRDRERLLEVARASSVLTHGHPAAVEASAAVSLAVALALEKKPAERIVEALIEECGARSMKLRLRLQQVAELRDVDPAVALGPDGLGEAWVAEEAVASALWCFVRSPNDFRLTVLTAANTQGDSDTIACIAGGLSGAFNGIDAIPRRWVEGIERSAELRALAARLHELS